MNEPWIMTTAELCELGIGRDALRRLCSQGVLVRLRRGVYRRARDTDGQEFRHWPLGEPEARHRLLIAATRPTLQAGSVFSHISAGVLHGLPLPARLLTKVSTLRNGSGSGTITRTTHRRYAHLPATDTIELDGFSVTTIARTVVDLAAVLRFIDAVAVVDAALARGVRSTELVEAIQRGRPHSRHVRAVVEFGDAKAESPGESRCRAAMKLAGVPIPVVQFHVVDPSGVEVARTDFGWVDHGVVGEFDGLVKYGRLLKAGQDVQHVILREKQREERIRGCGWWVSRWVDADLHSIERFRVGILRALGNGRATG